MESTEEFKSKLEGAAERYLAQQIVFALDNGWRTPEDFLAHFGPRDILQALTGADVLRSEILVGAAGVHERLASRKSVDSGAEDLQLALDEGLTSAAQVLGLFPPDDRVRYLDARKLWSFLTEHELSFTLPPDNERGRAAGRIAFMVQDALDEGLISIQDFADGVAFEEMAKRLPVSDLQRLVSHALARGRAGIPFSEERMLEVIPLPALIANLPLDHVYNQVVVGKVARPALFVTDDDGGGLESTVAAPEIPAAAAEKSPAPAELSSEKPVTAQVSARSAPVSPPPLPKSAPPPKPAKRKKPSRLEAELAGGDVDIDIMVDESLDVLAGESSSAEPLAASATSSPQEQARRRVTQKLEQIGRLPPSHERLALAILMSIESMYAELQGISSDEAREAYITDSFANESHLRTAMLALIELLDPKIDLTDPVILEADVDSLVKVVLFEERQRAAPARGGPSAVPPPPGTARRSANVPPPPPPPGTASAAQMSKLLDDFE
jgi:hypothetical protein